MVMTGISVGDYRDPERGLELGELMVEVAKVARKLRCRHDGIGGSRRPKATAACPRC